MSGARLPAYLSGYAREAEPRLKAFLEAKSADVERLPVDLRPALAMLRDYVLRGGKRLRGALVVLGCEAAGGTRAQALEASVGVELLHAYLLIHDDFMDRDEVRRGGPTLHTALGRALGDQLGGSSALLLGSLCEAWGLELVLSAPVAPERAVAAGRVVAQALQQVTAGQLADLTAPSGPELSEADVLAVQRMKTGSYTFELPLRLGAILGGASAAVLEALEKFARPLGQAFQIADDLLGTFGAPQTTGKPNVNDLREGKRTLLVVRALASAQRSDAAQLRAGLGKRDLSDAGAAGLRDILVRSGAEKWARAEAERLCAEALRALDGAPLPASLAAALREIAEYSVRRTL